MTKLICFIPSSRVLSSVDNLAQQTRRLELKAGPKENLAREAKKPSTRNAPVKKSSTRKAKTEELAIEVRCCLKLFPVNSVHKRLKRVDPLHEHKIYLVQVES